MKTQILAAIAMIIAFLSFSPSANASTEEKVCFRTSGAPQSRIHCFSAEWAAQRYDLNKALPMQKRTENPLDGKICFYPANAGVPSMRCYNKEWAKKNGMDMSKGFMPPRYVASMDADSPTTTECRTQQSNGKPKRVCYTVPRN